MSKLALKYGTEKLGLKEKDIESCSFSYADMGNTYSYVEFVFRMKPQTNQEKYISKQLKMVEFFEFIGECL